MRVSLQQGSTGQVPVLTQQALHLRHTPPLMQLPLRAAPAPSPHSPRGCLPDLDGCILAAGAEAAGGQLHVRRLPGNAGDELAVALQAGRGGQRREKGGGRREPGSQCRQAGPSAQAGMMHRQGILAGTGAGQALVSGRRHPQRRASPPCTAQRVCQWLGPTARCRRCGRLQQGQWQACQAGLLWTRVQSAFALSGICVECSRPPTHQKQRLLHPGSRPPPAPSWCAPCRCAAGSAGTGGAAAGLAVL